jgi:hypothetical protein
LLFALNHSDQAVNIPLSQPGLDLLSNTKLEKGFDLAPMQVAIVQQPAP